MSLAWLDYELDKPEWHPNAYNSDSNITLFAEIHFEQQAEIINRTKDTSLPNPAYMPSTVLQTHIAMLDLKKR